MQVPADTTQRQALHKHLAKKPHAQASTTTKRKNERTNERTSELRTVISSFVVRRSSFVVRRSSFVVRRSSFVVRRSSFVVRRSSFVVVSLTLSLSLRSIDYR